MLHQHFNNANPICRLILNQGIIWERSEWKKESRHNIWVARQQLSIFSLACAPRGSRNVIKAAETASLRRARKGARSSFFVCVKSEKNSALFHFAPAVGRAGGALFASAAAPKTSCMEKMEIKLGTGDDKNGGGNCRPPLGDKRRMIKRASYFTAFITS